MSELPYLDDKYLGGRVVDKHSKDLFMLQYTYLKRCYKKHEIIALESERRTAFYLASGQMKVYACNAQGGEKLLYYLEEGNCCFANYVNEENAVFLTTVAVAPCVVYHLDIEALFKELVCQEKMAINLLNNVESRISTIVNDLVNLANYNNKEKICKLIHSLAMRSTKAIEGCIYINRFPTREDAASFIGTHKSNVIKCLKDLENDGIIAKHKKGFIVKDMKALEDIIVEVAKA